jgi:hypothetical protein
MTDIFDLFEHDDRSQLGRLAKELSRADELRPHRIQLAGTNLLGLRAVEVSDVIKESLRQYADLLRAAERTLHGPDPTVEVPLGDVPIAYRATFDLVISKAGIELASFPMSAGLAIDLTQAVGLVQQGTLRRLDCHTVHAGATLTAAGRTVATKPVRLAPDVVLRLGDGIQLLPQPGRRQTCL